MQHICNLLLWLSGLYARHPHLLHQGFLRMVWLICFQRRLLCLQADLQAKAYRPEVVWVVRPVALPAVGRVEGAQHEGACWNLVAQQRELTLGAPGCARACYWPQAHGLLRQICMSHVKVCCILHCQSQRVIVQLLYEVHKTSMPH